MAKYKVTFQPAGVTMEVDPKALPSSRHSEPGGLLGIALAGGVHIEHACGGVGVCGTCHVIVTDGAENLSTASDDEMDVAAGVPGNTLQSRLACQAVVRGDVTVTVPPWNQNAVSEKA